jgi:Family of unknown function (DUF6283)
MIRPPAVRPCPSCPYWRGVPSGVWDASEYDKLPAYDRETPHQPPGVFLCHQQDGRVCAGWAGCHDMDESLALRLGIAMGALDLDTVRAIRDYESPVPLFSCGAEAAEHGRRDLHDPDQDARRIINKITGRPPRRTA